MSWTASSSRVSCSMVPRDTAQISARAAPAGITLLQVLPHGSSSPQPPTPQPEEGPRKDAALGCSTLEHVGGSPPAQTHTSGPSSSPSSPQRQQQHQQGEEEQPGPHQQEQQQHYLHPACRLRVVDWMHEVSEAVCFPGSTLADAVRLFDHFMAITEVAPPQTLLQLLALASMSLAVKHEAESIISPTMWLSLAVDESGNRLFEAWDLERMEELLLCSIAQFAR
ncbi:hypothetical protein Vafri_5057 [Volvox africanus]|uniref:Cyclin-like domain-containing protein n=1 Tax=Volvox africanus TaxID=51714 RepID=A0A8J4EUK2_9CHLO|nr:hypothetical protein Vafri_5057 [Volvox africanus]